MNEQPGSCDHVVLGPLPVPPQKLQFLLLTGIPLQWRHMSGVFRKTRFIGALVVWSPVDNWATGSVGCFIMDPSLSVTYEVKKSI